jgi:hypothetical protein
MHVHKIDPFELDIFRYKGSFHFLCECIVLTEFLSYVIYWTLEIQVGCIDYASLTFLVHSSGVPQGVLENSANGELAQTWV